MNEADAFEPDFKKEFFGPNYVRLLSIKDRYDPDQLFYAVTAVGSDRWENRADGRLCKTQTKG